jgi:predicted nucleotidyltransferase
VHDLTAHVERSGFPYTRDLIHLFVGGSELHGAKLGGTDDIDIYGLFIEPPERALGLEPLEHFVWSTAGNDRRNTADDVDLTLYSLRKWARLAVKGNPTALHFLFAPNHLEHPTWTRIVEQRSAFLARSCAPQFLGFADAQLKRMTGERGRGKKGQRPEIEARFGYDSKAAMHTLRLLYECLEVLQHGTITLPRPEREVLVCVRAGEFSLEKILEMAKKLFIEADEAEKSSSLPLLIDRDRVSQMISDAHLHHWERSHRDG